MTRVFRGSSLAEVSHLKNLVEQHGILCFIKNAQLMGGLGEIPFLECEPELWVLIDEEAAEARAIVAEAQAPAFVTPGATPWRCRRCSASNEPQFAACWQCGAGDAAG